VRFLPFWRFLTNSSGHPDFNLELPQFHDPNQGCQIFLDATYQIGKKIQQITIKYTIWLQNIPNGRKIG
jgi:hypothetical protein